jgi:hypothetical protein
MQNVSKFYYTIFTWSSTCFGRHTARHQDPKTALAASGFSYVKGCWTCRWWTLSGTLCLTTSTICTQRILGRNALLIINSIFLIKMRARENKGTLQQFKCLASQEIASWYLRMWPELPQAAIMCHQHTHHPRMSGIQRQSNSTVKYTKEMQLQLYHK